jgi:hypothetical protein
MIQRAPILLVLLLAACSRDIAGPQPVLNEIPAGLDVQLAVEPGEVAQHAPFAVRLDIRNTTSDTLRISTAHGCLAVPAVIRDGRRIPFEGSWWACTAAGASHTFAPGETRSHTWQMRAELYAEHPGDAQGAPAPRGTYRIRAEFDVPRSGAERPGVERTLRVR